MTVLMFRRKHTDEGLLGIGDTNFAIQERNRAHHIIVFVDSSGIFLCTALVLFSRSESTAWPLTTPTSPLTSTSAGTGGPVNALRPRMKYQTTLMTAKPAKTQDA
jgi:hypothetical protein